MNKDQILSALKEQREALKKLVADSQVEIIRLDGAISALDGKLPAIVAPTKHRDGPSVTEIMKECLPIIGKGVAFDNHKLISIALQKHPDFDQRKLKRGVYPAVKWLLKENLVRRCPGGLCIV